MREKTYQTTLLIRGDAKDAVRQVQLTRDQLEGLTGAQSRNTTITGRFAAAFENANRRVAGATRSLSGFQGLIATLGVGKLVSETIQATNQYASLQGQLALVTDSQEELNQVYDRSIQLANRTGQSTDATINLYARLARSTEQLEMSQNDLFTITEAINQSFIVSGASAQESSSAILQLSQGLAAGALRGEELNSVMENSPRLARAIADGLGVTIGQLRAMGAEGELTAERVTRALLATADTINEDFQKMPMTIGRVWQAVTNDLNDALGQVETGDLIDEMEELRETLSSPEFKQSITTLAESLLSVATNGVKATNTMVGLAGFLADEFSASVNGAAAGDLPRLEDELASIEKRLDSTAWVFLATDERVAELRDRAEELREQIRLANPLLNDNAAALENAAEKAEDAGDKSGHAAINVADLAEAQAEAEKAAKAAAKAQKEYEGSLDKLLSSLYPAQAETRRLRDEYLLLAEAISRGDAGGGSLHDWIDANLEIEVTAKRVKKETIELKDQADPLATAYERGIERMDDGFADFFKTTLRNGKVTFDGLKNIFLDTLGEMIYAAARNPIMTTFAIGGGSSTAAASGGSAGAGGLSSLSSLFGGSVSGLYQTIGTGLSNLGATGLGDMAYNAGLRYSGLGGAAMGIGGGIAGGLLGNAVFGSTSGIGSTLGGIAGGMLIPIPGLGTAIGSFLGSGLESLFGGKPSDKRQYASGGFSSTDQILSGFDGRKFSQENQDAAAALLGQIQQMGMAIGGTTAAGSVSVGGRTGLRLSTGQGEDSFRTFATAEELLNAAFEEVLAGATSLAPAVKTLAQAFEGGRDQAIVYTQSLQGLWDQTQINPVDQAMKDIASQQGTLYSGYQKQISGLRDLIGEYDGSLGSTQQLSQALAVSQQSAYQLTATIRGLSQEMGAMFESSAQQIRESVMSDQERLRSWIAERDQLRASLDTLVDPQKIAEAGREIDRLNNLAFNALANRDEEVAEAYARVSEQTGRRVEQRLRATERELRQESSAINQEIRSMMTGVADDMNRAARDNLQASQNQLQAVQAFQSVVSQLQARGIPIQTISSETV